MLEVAIYEALRPEEDDQAYRKAIERLRKVGPDEVWRLIKPLARDERPAIRALVPDTLRYFNPHPLREETVALLAEMLETEASTLVLSCIAAAFVDLGHERAADLLPALLHHADANVRTSALCGLLPLKGSRTLPSFLLASTDPDRDVRNWATFGLRMVLGELGEADVLDTEEVRKALADRLMDEDAEIRGEAILALATRRDERALGPLKRELRSWPDWDHCLEAAEHFRSAELVPLLEALLEEHPEWGAALEGALEACRDDAR